jgi:hypothetical protein
MTPRSRLKKKKESGYLIFHVGKEREREKFKRRERNFLGKRGKEEERDGRVKLSE